MDDGPTVANAMADVTVNEDAVNTTIDLSAVFNDIDSNAIAKSVVTNTNNSLVTASIDGDTLTLTYGAGQNGVAKIASTVNADRKRLRRISRAASTRLLHNMRCFPCWLIRFNTTVQETENPFRIFSHLLLMRDQDNRDVFCLVQRG